MLIRALIKNGNELIHGDKSTGGGDVITHERLGGLLKSYRRSTA